MPGAINPIPEVQIGAVAYLFGILNSGTAIALTGVASFELDSDDQTYTWTEKKNKDTTGNTQNIIETEFIFDRTLKFTPSGATRAAAHAVADAVVSLQVAIIANYKLATFNGTYRIKPGTKVSLKMDDNGSIDIPLERWANAPQNAQLTGTPIVG